MRILTVHGVLLLFPIIALLYSMVGFVRTPSRWRLYLPFYIYFIFIAAYCYTPPIGSNVDLVRYFAILDEIKGMSLTETINRLADSLYAENVLYWLIAHTNMPHLLPAVTTATVYGIGAYIACDIVEPEDYQYLFMVLMVEAITIPFFTVVVNIRNVFAFSMIILAAYLDMHKHKRTIGVLLLYIIPVFMHKTGIIVLFARVLVPVLKRTYVAALVMIFTLPAVIEFAYSHISMIRFGGPIGQITRKLVNSSYVYLLGESEYAERVRNSTGAAIMRYLVFAFLIFMLVLYVQKFRKNRELLDFEVMGYLMCILSLSCNAIDTPAYWRFAAAFSLMIPSLLYSFFKGELTSGFLRRWLSYGLMAYLVLRFALMIHRASIDWPETLSALAFTNIYTLTIQLINQLFAI